MSKANNSILYCDTDSIFFTNTRGANKLQTGNELDAFTDELLGDMIEIFISCRCKNYSYKLKSGSTVAKVKGFTLNFTNSKIINFDSMKKIVTLDPDKVRENHIPITLTGTKLIIHCGVKSR